VNAPTRAEVREWARGLGLPVPPRGYLPDAVYVRWDREHPDRPARGERRAERRPPQVGLFPSPPSSPEMQERRSRGGQVTARRAAAGEPTKPLPP
jgi:hypothetical protein